MQFLGQFEPSWKQAKHCGSNLRLLLAGKFIVRDRSRGTPGPVCCWGVDKRRSKTMGDLEMKLHDANCNSSEVGQE